MAPEPPAPQALLTRLAEDPQVIQPRVAAPVPIEAGLEPLDVVEYVLQTHDRRDRDVPGGDESHRRPLLCWALLMDGEWGAFPGW